MSGFTKGPWSIGDENCGGGFNVVAANGARVAHTMEVAKHAPGGPVTAVEASANARLVAAAPDLLHELRLLNVDENGEQKRNTPAWRAIAKATQP